MTTPSPDDAQPTSLIAELADHARLIAALAIALGAVAWLLVPAALALLFLTW
ncbi:hypothetical protein [Tepidiforma sp.]|uniref:hypothetical protein n=1 Tax=Tepidiforma sp. TaxID=2682230 RepID=UPI002ADD894D|nr:hypothetical protein [Tepidiforma sp.]